MWDSERHVCMLPREPELFDLPPTANFCRKLVFKVYSLQLPCEWHHGSVVCLRSRHALQLERARQLAAGARRVWHPFSPLKHYWDCIALFFNALSFVYLPFQVFLDCPVPYDKVILLSDVISFVDIYTKFVTGCDKDDGRRVILDPKEIARRYVRSTFALDLIGAFPFQFIGEVNCTYPLHTSWYILKWFRFLSMMKQWKNIYKQIRLSYISATAFKVLARTFHFFHWSTYVYYQIPLLYASTFDTAVERKEWLKKFEIFKEDYNDMFDKYTACLYRICGLVIGAGYRSPINEIVELQLVMDSIISLFGLVFLVYSFTTLLRLSIYNRFDMLMFNGRLKELQEYMLYKQLPEFLQRKIQLFINYKFYEHYFNEQAITKTINDQIKQEINMHCCKRLVMNVPLFQDMPVALINAIIFSLTRAIFMPGEAVVKCNQPGKSIYLIYSGTVAVINSAGREESHLRDGSYFGEFALLAPGSPRSATVIALEISEMYKLSSQDLQACLQPYPHLKRRLDNINSLNTQRRRY